MRAPSAQRERKGLDALAGYMEQTGMVLLMHLNEPVGHRYPGKTEADFGEVAAFVEAHPALKIILAHLGGGICFYELMPEIRKAFSLVYYDLAAAPFLYSDDLYRFAAAFLPDKVLFGSDYPLLTLSRYRPAMDGLGRRGKGEVPVGQREASFWRLTGTNGTGRASMPGRIEAHGLVERFSPLMPPGKPVIDIAMGQGRDLLFLAGKGFPVYGLERSGEAIKLAGQAAEERAREHLDGAGRRRSLPFKPAVPRDACSSSTFS